MLKKKYNTKQLTNSQKKLNDSFSPNTTIKNKNNNIYKLKQNKYQSEKKFKNNNSKLKKINKTNNNSNIMKKEGNQSNKNDKKKKKVIIYNLKLTKKDITKLLNDPKIKMNQEQKINDNTSLNKINLNNQKILKNLYDKQKSLINEIEKIKEQKNFLGEYSLNNLQKKNIFYKNIQEDNIKSLEKNENNILEKISSINQQIININDEKKNINNSNDNILREEYLEKINQEKKYNNIAKRMKILQIQTNLNNQKRIKDIELNQEKRNKEVDLIEKEITEKKNNELMEKKNEERKIIEQRRQEINSKIEKYKPFINNINPMGRNKNYLYKRMASSFEKKEEKYIHEILKNKSMDDNNNNNKKNELKKNNLLLKKKEITENLKKIWKERSNLLPKYISPLYQKVLYSEENLKEDKLNKIEYKKSLFEIRQKYAKEKIHLPHIRNKILKLSSEKNEKKIILRNNETLKHINSKSLSINLMLNRNNNGNFSNNKYDNLNNKKINNLNISNDKKITKSYSCIYINKKINNGNMNFNLENKTPGEIYYINGLRKGSLAKNKNENNESKTSISDNNNNNNKEINLNEIKGKIEVMEDKYNRGKKLLKVRGGYINNKELGDEMNQLLIDSIKNKLDIIENMNN